MRPVQVTLEVMVQADAEGRVETPVRVIIEFPKTAIYEARPREQLFLWGERSHR